MHTERWRAALPVVAAVAVVAALSLLTVSVMTSFGSGDDDQAYVGTDTSTTTTEAPTRRTAPRPTTTTTIVDGPEVLGETTVREPDDATPQPAPGSAPAPTPATPAATAPATTAPAPTSPPTTVCRNSTDPSCGPFAWDPQPDPYEVEVYAVSTPISARAGEPVTFAVDYVDPAGPDAEGACLNWWVSDPAVVNTSSCEVIATACGRTGPHDAPAPSRDRIALERTIVFETPGEHEVRIEGNIATHLADGCESPYRNTFTRTFTITVA